MSVDQRPPYRMPQPEQWLSEHPVIGTLMLICGYAAIVCVFLIVRSL